MSGRSGRRQAARLLLAPWAASALALLLCLGALDPGRLAAIEPSPSAAGAGQRVIVSGIETATPDWVPPLPAPLHVTRGFQPPATRYSAGRATCPAQPSCPNRAGDSSASHRGVDLAAPTGSPVLAAGAGTISWAGPLAGRGVVVVTHGSLRTTYEPVVPLVAVGERVAPGAPIGRLAAGHPGCPSTACLHWGLLRGDRYLDPLTLLRLGPVRLLPLDDES